MENEPLKKRRRLSLTGKGEASNYYPFYLLCWCSPFLSLFPSCANCMCAQSFPPQRLKIRSTPTRESQSQKIILNISIHHTLHIYTLLCFVLVLFCFVSHSRSVSVRFEISLTPPEHVSHNRTFQSLGGSGNMAKCCD